MSTTDDQSNDNGGGTDEAPAIVLPSPNSQGVGGQPSGIAPGTLIAPQPILDDGTGGGDSNLAGRIEQTLAEDGRFSGLTAGLVITTDDSGVVHLSGSLPSESRRRSLLATLRALPGVTDVQNNLSTPPTPPSSGTIPA